MDSMEDDKAVEEGKREKTESVGKEKPFLNGGHTKDSNGSRRENVAFIKIFFFLVISNNQIVTNQRISVRAKP